MELLQLLDLLFFGIFILLPLLIFYWIEDLFHICRKIGMLNFSVLYSVLYSFLMILVFGVGFILEVHGVWKSVSIYVLQLL